MTVFQIEAFITLAATLNFTKASNLIHMTQPNLSKLIVAMEKELGVQLVQRTRRDVRLTPAGSAFLKDARVIAGLYERAVKNVQEVAAGIRGTIKVGFMSTALIYLLPKIVSTFQERNPSIVLELYDYTFSPLMSSLLDNRIDVALVPDRELDSIPKLEKKFLYADDMCVVLPCDHPLNTGDGVDLAAFSDEPFVIMDPKISDRDYELVYSICMANGFYPKVNHEVNTLNNLLLMVECGRGISILARHMQHYATGALDFIGIRGSESAFKMVCAWWRDKNPCIPRLLDVIDDCLA
ncbi:MAG: LysR family transcriptional regulator [Clostridiales bacterium]|jgi:DNA-binding transcriptional LysR family regulator|nr:LysR family transcriptional regulator [Clostridiales bacterium]